MGVAPNATKPPTVPQDSLKEKNVPSRMEIMLTTLPMLAKGDPKSKDSEAALPQSAKAPPKEKIVIKKKQFGLIVFFFFFTVVSVFKICHLSNPL